MESRDGEWDREMTEGRIWTRVPVGVQAHIWSGLLLVPQCPPKPLILKKGKKGLHIFKKSSHSQCWGNVPIQERLCQTSTDYTTNELDNTSMNWRWGQVCGKMIPEEKVGFVQTVILFRNIEQRCRLQILNLFINHFICVMHFISKKVFLFHWWDNSTVIWFDI